MSFFTITTLQTDNNTEVRSNHSYLGLILKRFLPIATVKKEKEKKNALEVIFIWGRSYCISNMSMHFRFTTHHTHRPFQNKTFQHIQPYRIPLKDTMKLLHIQTAKSVDLPIGPLGIPMSVLNICKCYIWKWNGWFYIICTFPCPWHALYDKMIHLDLEISS